MAELDSLREHLELRLEIADKSLDFLEPGTSRYETCGAINTDLYRLYALRNQLDQLTTGELADWKDELEAGKVVRSKIRDGLTRSQGLRERVKLVKFPKGQEVATRHHEEQSHQQPSQKSDKPEKSKLAIWPYAKQVAAKKPSQPAGCPKLAYLTVQEFEGVPKYMKGRFTYDAFNEVVDEFNSALAAKYDFLRKGFQAMASIHDKKRFKEWRSQESKETKGRHFVVANDLRLQPTLKSEGNRQKVFTILRHVHRVQEIRGPGPIHRYCVR